MPHFICSVSTASDAPAAYALTEQVPSRDGGRPSYHLRELGRFGSNDPVDVVQDVLADEAQYAGNVTVVVMGGRQAADRFADVGLSAVPVAVGERADGDTLRTSEQTLVDTFASVYRHRAVEMPGTMDHVSDVLAALYNAMSEDAGADEASPEMEALATEETTGEPTEPIPDDGPNPDVIAQSGSSAALSTAQVGGDESDRDATVDEAMTAPDQRRGLVDDRNDGPVDFGADFGEVRDLALAVALACWYGEYSADELPLTDQADETARAERIRERRRRAARDRQNR